MRQSAIALISGGFELLLGLPVCGAAFAWAAPISGHPNWSTSQREVMGQFRRTMTGAGLAALITAGAGTVLGWYGFAELMLSGAVFVSAAVAGGLLRLGFELRLKGKPDR